MVVVGVCVCVVVVCVWLWFGSGSGCVSVGPSHTRCVDPRERFVHEVAHSSTPEVWCGRGLVIQSVEEGAKGNHVEYVCVAAARGLSKLDEDELCVCRGCYDWKHEHLPHITFREVHTGMQQDSEIAEELSKAAGPCLTGTDRAGSDWTGSDRIGPDRAGSDRIGPGLI